MHSSSLDSHIMSPTLLSHLVEWRSLMTTTSTIRLTHTLVTHQPPCVCPHTQQHYQLLAEMHFFFKQQRRGWAFPALPSDLSRPLLWISSQHRRPALQSVKGIKIFWGGFIRGTCPWSVLYIQWKSVGAHPVWRSRGVLPRKMNGWSSKRYCCHLKKNCALY